MTQGSTIWGRFVAELRRRHVGRVALAYAAVAFVVLQAAEIVLPAFDLPEWGLRVVVVFAFLGFPVALALAWIYDITRHGIERTPDGAFSGRPEVRLLPRLAFVAITILVAVGGGWWFLESTVTGVPGGQAAGSPGSGAPPELVPAAYEPGTPITSLAVLPLDDFSEERDQAYFVAGMHEALVSALSQLDGVRLVSRTTVMQYERTSKTMPQIARDLRVDGIVEGSVLRAGDRVRITVQLIHAPSDTHLWSESYEEELSDIIALQREVASDITAEVLQELNLEPTGATFMLADLDPAVRDEYMKGRFQQSRGTPESLQQAAQHFEAAIEMDSAFAPAFAALSSTLILLGDMPGVAQVDLTLAEDAAARALELDAESPEAMAVLSAIVPAPPDEAMPAPGVTGTPGVRPTPSTPETERVARAHEIRLRVQADSLTQERREAWVAELTGMGGEAAMIPILQKAMGMGRIPRARQVEIAHVLLASGHTEEAVDVLESVVAEMPHLAPAWSALERAHTARGDFEAGVDVRLARMAELEGRDDAGLASLAHAFDTDGEMGYWEWCRADLESRLAEGKPVGPADMATTYAALGERELAYEWLDRAVQIGDPGLMAMRTDPVWDAYRDDPRFRELARRIRSKPAPLSGSRQRPGPPV
jgi:TolB-like protein